MKFAGARGITRSRVPLIAMLALAATIGLAGCSGDDGKDGDPGTPGGIGPTGPTGPTGPVAGIEKPLESCAVCHGDNSIASVATAHPSAKDIAVTDVTIGQSLTNVADLTLTFTVLADAAPYTTLTTAARQYQFDGTLRNTLNAIDSTVPGDVETPATLSGGAGGKYTITIAGGMAKYGTVPSRYLFRLETPNGSADPRVMVTADFPTSPDKVLVSTAGCSGCHGTDGQGGFHYSYPASGANCTVCHDATNTDYPRLVNIGHSIHASELMPAGEYQLKDTAGGDVEDPYKVTFPTYLTNCSICHTGTETTGALAEVNKMPVTYAGCMSCHGDMSYWKEIWDSEPVLDFHASMNSTTVCTQCHISTGLAELDTVAEMHNGLETERVGIIWNGEDKSVTEGKKFTWDITGITDDGTNLKITWVATYNGNSVNPCNTTVADGAPGFYPYGPNTANEGTISVLRSYVQGDDYVLGKASGPGQANSVNLSTTNTVCSGNVATTTIPVEAGVTAGMRGVLALQGKPTVPLPAGFSSSLHAADWPYTTMFARVRTPLREFVVGTGALPTTTRRPIADTADCLRCHVGSLYQHGNNRVDNVDLCVMCHNSASSDQGNRAQMGVDASEAYDGKIGQTFELKTMLHALHTVENGALNPADKTFAIYRTRGIYAWAPEGVTPPNWSTTACEKATPTPGQEYLVYGADPTLDVSCQPHTLYHPTFPRPDNDCAACHKAGFSTMVDQTKGVATTLDAGVAPWNNQLDDQLQGANTAACTSCHRDAAVIGHANQNGWVPTTFPEGRQTIIDAAK